MDLFKKTNVRHATAIDYNCKCYKSNTKTQDGKVLNRLARRKLKQNLIKEIELSEVII